MRTHKFSGLHDIAGTETKRVRVSFAFAGITHEYTGAELVSFTAKQIVIDAKPRPEPVGVFGTDPHRKQERLIALPLARVREVSITGAKPEAAAWVNPDFIEPAKASEKPARRAKSEEEPASV